MTEATRNRKVIDQFLGSSETYEQIAEKYDITIEKVRQILLTVFKEEQLIKLDKKRSDKRKLKSLEYVPSKRCKECKKIIPRKVYQYLKRVYCDNCKLTNK